MYHQVERPFSGDGLTRLRGEAVNPEAWRNGRRLIDQRFLSSAPVTSEPTACPCGRLWVEEVAEHDCRKPEAVMLEPVEGEGEQAPTVNRGGRPRKVG